MRKCCRTIDKPLLLFGLEPEDVGVLVLSSAAVILFFDTFYAGCLFFGGWIFLRLLKRGKPEGYIVHLFYGHGIRIKGLIDPPLRVSRYSVFR
jgi:hypothetical protein